MWVIYDDSRAAFISDFRATRLNRGKTLGQRQYWLIQIHQIFVNYPFSFQCFFSFLAFYGVLFPLNQEPAFSNYRLWESLGFVISFAYGDYLCVDVKMYILIAVLLIGVSLYGVIEYMRSKEGNSQWGEIKDRHSNESL